MNYILTNDPSLTAWGWAVLTANGRVVDGGAIKTEPSSKKLNIRKGSDRIRRVKEINAVLIRVIREYDIKLIFSEQPHGSQSAVAAFMVGLVAGIMQTHSDCFDIPLEWFTEADAKKAVSGKRSVPKKEMIALMSERYEWEGWTGIQWRDEAVADSLAVHYVATQQSEFLKLLKTKRRK